MNIQSATSLVKALKATQADLNTVETQISTGNAFQTAGDNPQGWMEANSLSLNISDASVKLSTLGTVSDSLSFKESVMTQMQDVIGRAKELAILANNGANGNITDIAAEAKILSDQFVSLANAKDGSGNYMFSGVASNQKALTFDSISNQFTYTGSASVTSVTVEGSAFSLNSNGSFLASIANTLKSFSDQVTANTKPNAAMISSIDSAMSSVLTEVSRNGAIADRAEKISSFLTSKSDMYTERLIDVSKVDMVAAVSKQKAAATQYDAISALLANNANRKSVFDLLF